MRFTRQQLQEVYHRSCDHEGFLNIFIYRKISLRLAVAAAYLRMTPNQISGLSFIASVAAAVMFVSGDYQVALWALAPFHIGKILDCADGQLASLTNQRSKLGAFLDPFYDRLSDLLLLVALAIGYFVAGHGSMALWLMGALTSVWFLGAYLDTQAPAGATKLEQLRHSTQSASPYLQRLLKWDGGFTGLITTLAVIFGQIPLLIGLFLVVAALPLPFQLRRIILQLRTEKAA